MEELAKIPALWHHYLEHKAMAGGLSFIDFLTAHYNRPSHDDHSQEHKNLPFYEHQCPGLVFLVPAFRFLLHNPSDTLEPIHHLYKEAFFAPPAIEYWQPPKSIA